MGFRIVASANGAVSVVTGLVGIFAPAMLAALFQETASERESAVIQMLAASYLGFGALTWVLRGATDASTQRGVAVGSVAAWAASLAVSFVWLRLVSGQAVWGTIALQIAFALAWGYVLLVASSSPGRNERRTLGA